MSHPVALRSSAAGPSVPIARAALRPRRAETGAAVLAGSRSCSPRRSRCRPPTIAGPDPTRTAAIARRNERHAAGIAALGEQAGIPLHRTDAGCAAGPGPDTPRCARRDPASPGVVEPDEGAFPLRSAASQQSGAAPTPTRRFTPQSRPVPRFPRGARPARRGRPDEIVRRALGSNAPATGTASLPVPAQVDLGLRTRLRPDPHAPALEPGASPRASSGHPPSRPDRPVPDRPSRPAPRPARPGRDAARRSPRNDGQPARASFRPASSIGFVPSQSGRRRSRGHRRRDRSTSSYPNAMPRGSSRHGHVVRTDAVRRPGRPGKGPPEHRRGPPTAGCATSPGRWR